jgi:hypothetical protein
VNDEYDFEVTVWADGHCAAYPKRVSPGFTTLGEVKEIDAKWWSFESSEQVLNHGVATRKMAVQSLMRKAGLGGSFIVVDDKG